MAPRNTLFEASAGTGKTYQVTRLYQAMLLGRPYPGDGGQPVFEGDPIDCRDILMLTFARNAAAEMRTRIVEGIERELTLAALEEQPKYWRILRALSGAGISTIHAYARRLLGEHALLAGVSPAVALMEESTAEELFEEVTSQHLLDCLDGPDPDLRASLELLCLTRRVQGRPNAPGVVEVTMDLVRKARAWGLCLDQFGEEDIAALAHEPAPPRRRDLADLRGSLIATFPDKRPAGAARLLTGLDDALRELPEDAGGEAVAARAAGLRAVTGGGSWGRSDAAKAARRDAVAALERLAAYPDGLQARGHLVAFLRFAAGCHRLFQEGKRERGVLDNDDLILCALELLRENEQVAPGFKVIIVDEAQDNSRVQNELIECLAERSGASVILCGDWKQAIYTWRGADPGGLHRLADALEERAGLLRKPLTTSYRSQKDLVEWINDAVAQHWVFGAEYRDQDRLHPRDIAEPTGGPNVELLLPPWEYGTDPFEEVEVPLKKAKGGDEAETKHRFDLTGKDLRQLGGEGGGETDWEVLEPRYARRASMEARAVARRIKLLCSRSSDASWKPAWMWDAEAGRWRETEETPGYRYRDVLILLRATSYQDLYETALREAGIRYTTDGKGRGFFFRQEVRDICSLVAWLAWPLDDVALAALVRSPFIGLGDPAVALLSEALAVSATHGTERSDRYPRGAVLRRALQAEAAHAATTAGRLRRAGLEDDAGLFLEAVPTLHRLRQLAGRVPAVELVREAIRLTGYDAVLAGGFHGVQKLANMRKMLSLLQDKERRENLDLQAVARWLTEQVNATQAPDAVVFDPDDDAVRISTVHAAKGLTSPVVVMPDLRRKRRPDTGWVLVRGAGGRPEGLAAKFKSIDGDGTVREIRTADHQTARDEARQREERELRRLFYVAATRPRDLLILSGETVSDPSAWRRWVNDHLSAMLGAREADDVVRCIQPRSYDEIETAYGGVREADEGAALPPSADLAAAGTVHAASTVTRHRIPVTLLTGFPRLPDDEASRRRFEEEVRTYAASRLVGLEPARAANRVEDAEPADAATDYALRGTAGHEVLEHFDFSRRDDIPGRVADALRALPGGPDATGDLGPVLAAAVEHLCRRLQGASHVLREVPFSARFEHEGARCIVDGKIDLVYFRDGTWHITDYKFANASEPELRSRYGLQLQVYRSALSRAQEDGSRRVLLAEAPDEPAEVRMTLMGISSGGEIATADVEPLPDQEVAATVVRTARFVAALSRGDPLPW